MQVEAIFNTVWDGGYVISTKCMVDATTGVIQAETVDADEVEVLDREYVEFGGLEYEVFCNEQNVYVIEDFNKFQQAIDSVLKGVFNV